MKRSNLVGFKTNMLTVIEYSHVNKDGECCWSCVCDCGNHIVIRGRHIKTGDQFSCGCVQTIYKTSLDKDLAKRYLNMKERCYNKNNRQYKDYGKRGISICDEWYFDIWKFIVWAKENGYKKNLEIDRTNNNGNYEPSNCRWTTREINMRNTRANVLNPGLVRKIRKIYVETKSPKTISQRMCIGLPTIRKVVYGETWINI